MSDDEPADDGIADVAVVSAPASGRLTFDAEGQEGGIFHSRRFHVPSVSSGLTIGRGYDMKRRTQAEVRSDLVKAGVEPDRAALISEAAGLKGERPRCSSRGMN